MTGSLYRAGGWTPANRPAPPARRAHVETANAAIARSVDHVVNGDRQLAIDLVRAGLNLGIAYGLAVDAALREA